MITPQPAGGNAGPAFGGKLYSYCTAARRPVGDVDPAEHQAAEEKEQNHGGDRVPLGGDIVGEVRASHAMEVDRKDGRYNNRHDARVRPIIQRPGAQFRTMQPDCSTKPLHEMDGK